MNYEVDFAAPYKVYFNTINNSYQVQRSSDSAYATDPFTRANLIINFASDPEHNGVTIPSTTLDSNTVQFDWKGIPLDSLGTALTSEKSVTLAYKGLTRVIYITPATGRVRLQ